MILFYIFNKIVIGSYFCKILLLSYQFDAEMTCQVLSFLHSTKLAIKSILQHWIDTIELLSEVDLSHNYY